MRRSTPTRFDPAHTNRIAHLVRSYTRKRLRVRGREWRLLRRGLAGGLLASLLLFARFTFAQAHPASKPEIPEVNAGVGACSADFLVRDASGKPLYDAKIVLAIHYGFLGLHRIEVQVGTNADGRARVIGLPAKSKKPLEFTVRYKQRLKSVIDDPGSNCRAQFDVRLAE